MRDRSNRKIPIVYMIIAPDNSVYVGASLYGNDRLGCYKNISKSTKAQPGIYKSLIEHGWEAHKVILVKGFSKDISRQELDKYEDLVGTHLMNKGYTMLNKKGFGANGKTWPESIEKNRQAHLGKKASDTTKAKMSAKSKGRKHTAEIRLSMSLNHKGKRSVVQFDKSMNIIREWGSAAQASKELGISRPNICACCTGGKAHIAVGGYFWKFKDKP